MLKTYKYMDDRRITIQAKMFGLIEQWKESGLPKKEFCVKQQVANATFHYWFKKYKNQDAVKFPAFIPIRVRASNPTQVFAELVLVDGKKITFYNSVDASFLKTLLF
jgi:hypothetical protein